MKTKGGVDLAIQSVSPEFEEATFKKVAGRLIPFLFICYIVAFLDRVNVGFAKLQMAPDLKFSDAVYGFGMPASSSSATSSSRSRATSFSRRSARACGSRGSW
jgi:sugar phosphate permease